MLDGLSIDQLRTFVAVVDEGSFSAAGRHLGRAQSVVSQAIGNLESNLKVRLFERTARLPRLTEQGQALVERARAVVESVDGLRSFASELAGGVETELSVALDALFPTAAVTRTVTAFRARFPNTPLRVYVDVLGALLELVAERRCAFAIVGTLPSAPPRFTMGDPLVVLDYVFVASSRHPLARHRGRIRRAELHHHVHLVLSDRSKVTEGRNFGVSQGAVWRLADFGAKLAFLRAGLGWGGVPRHLVASELRRRELVVIDAREALTPLSPPYSMPVRPVNLAEAPPGPAGRWFIEQLKEKALVELGRRTRRAP
jgi:DNA-binding transcriptional LysR family regulator